MSASLPPVGCVIAKNGEIISRAHNEREGTLDPTAHAEVAAIRDNKDIATRNGLLEEVNKYREAVDELLDIDEKITTKIPSLEEWKRRNDKSWKMDKTLVFVIAVASAVTSAVIVPWIKSLF